MSWGSLKNLRTEDFKHLSFCACMLPNPFPKRNQNQIPPNIRLLRHVRLVSAEAASCEVVFKNKNEKTKDFNNDKPLSPSHCNFSLICSLKI